VETLDRVLVELADLGRAVGQIDAEDLQSARSAQSSNRLTERVSNDWFFANRALRRSIPMVLDPEIRAVARQMADAAARAAVGAVKPNEGNEQRTLAMLAAQEDAEERIGQRIRELYLAGVVLPDVPTRLYEHQITPRGSTGLP